MNFGARLGRQLLSRSGLKVIQLIAIIRVKVIGNLKLHLINRDATSPKNLHHPTGQLRYSPIT